MTARRKQKKSTGGMKGFILLIVLTVGVLYLYQNAEQIFTPERIQAIANKTKAKASVEAKTPNWVAWELTRKETEGDEGRTNKFLPDPELPEPRVVTSDYTNSGYDRGHMAPAADMKWSKQAMKESFYMSNICPQNRKLNRDDWGDLEESCRKWADKYGTIYIACGPIYDSKSPKRIGESRVAVPDRFFKVVLVYNRKNPMAMGFLFENKANHQDLKNYMVTVDKVEEETGLDFFPKVPDSIEKRIESTLPEQVVF